MIKIFSLSLPTKLQAHTTIDSFLLARYLLSTLPSFSPVHHQFDFSLYLKKVDLENHNQYQSSSLENQKMVAVAMPN